MKSTKTDLVQRYNSDRLAKFGESCEAGAGDIVGRYQASQRVRRDVADLQVNESVAERVVSYLLLAHLPHPTRQTSLDQRNKSGRRRRRRTRLVRRAEPLRRPQEGEKHEDGKERRLKIRRLRARW